MENTETVDKYKEVIMNERKFLHDISNHIVVAHGMASFVQKSLQNNPAVDAKDLERLNKAIDAINKMTAQLKDRRAVLHEMS